MDNNISKYIAFRALLLLTEVVSEQTQSENLGILAFEMQPAPGSISSDPALFAVWERIWGDGDKDALKAAEVANEFIAQEADWGSDDDGPAVLQQSLKAASADASSPDFNRWLECLRQARGIAC